MGVKQGDSKSCMERMLRHSSHMLRGLGRPQPTKEAMFKAAHELERPPLRSTASSWIGLHAARGQAVTFRTSEPSRLGES